VTPALHWPSLADPLCELARRAGDAILRVYDAAPQAQGFALKSDATPVTAADLEAHGILAEGLKALTPSTPVVSEEDPASFVHRRPEGEYWLLDPLDGTREFLARNGEFTVNIALVRDGCAVGGVVHAPVLAATYWGGRGKGAWRSEAGQTTALHVRAPATGARLRVVASRSNLDAATQAYIESLGDVQLVQAGSSLKFCRLAEGRADLYPRFGPTCEWDTAAAQAVLEGAGGRVHDLQGAPLRYGKPEVLNPHFIAST
jgi:3'(2'), 5'-bisphosphate nucleotidase